MTPLWRWRARAQDDDDLRQVLHAVDERLARLEAAITAQSEASAEQTRVSEELLRSVGNGVQRIEHALGAGSVKWDEAPLVTRIDRLSRVLFAIRSREAENRERLYEVRSSAEYCEAYTDPNPLVSILIPTLDRVDSLLTRSLPSVLGQSHENVEAIIIGDGSPPAVAEAIAALDDPRVRYIHLTTNGPYPHDPIEAWHIKGSPGVNAGLFAAKGRWISFFADDDELRPDAVATVLHAVREHRYELCYGRTSCTLHDGRTSELGVFPPKVAHIALQGALLHASLRFLQHDLSDAELLVPNDWSLMHRLMRLGGRVGFVDAVLANYFETAPPCGGG